MQRAIIVPATLSGAALAELKGWLAITLSAEDAALTALLRMALEMCEAFTGQMPLEAECEEVLRASGQWQHLRTLPVQAVLGVEGVDAAGGRFVLDAVDYEIELDARGGASCRLLRPGAAERLAVRFSAGIAAEWSALPEALRHGMLRLAAHQYRERDAAALASVPPAAIAALWRPWRVMRIA